MASDTARTSRMHRPLALAGGLLALAVVTAPLQTSGAAFTSRTVNPASGITAASDWTPPTVDLAGVLAIRNGSTVTATASDADSGVRDVVISWAPTGTQTWTVLCTRTTAPYECVVPTAGMPADIDLRAVATDRAGYSSTDLVEDVSVDNVAPTIAFGTIAKTISGVTAIPATASDVDTYVTSVAIGYRTAGSAAAFTGLCTDTTVPYGCSFDTTKVPDGSYELEAVAVDLAGNRATTSTTVAVDNRNASVSVVQPEPNFLRGIATVRANAFSNVAIASVAIEWSTSSAPTATWARLCADTTSPYSCDWDTTKIADGAVFLRAILTDTKGTVTSALVATTIDNSPLRGVDVQAANGGIAGRPDAGDTITLTYSRVLNPASVLAVWSGSATPVTVRLRDGGLVGLGGTDDTLDVIANGSNLNNPTLVGLGSVNLATDQVKRRSTATFAATITLATTTVNGQQASVVTITLGALSSGRAQELRTSSVLPIMTWTPSATAKDAAGAAASVAPVTETGATDRDL